MDSPKLLQSYLLDGTIEGVRIIELSESSVKAFVIPRLKLNDVKNREEINWPSLYFLINSGENQLYIGESENSDQYHHTLLPYCYAQGLSRHSRRFYASHSLTQTMAFVP